MFTRILLDSPLASVYDSETLNVIDFDCWLFQYHFSLRTIHVPKIAATLISGGESFNYLHYLHRFSPTASLRLLLSYHFSPSASRQPFLPDPFFTVSPTAVHQSLAISSGSSVDAVLFQILAVHRSLTGSY